MDLLIPMFALGLVTSVHCISMCGPMVVTYAVKETEASSWKSRLAPNLSYQGAKITSYMVVGLALGAIGSAFNLDAVRPYVMLAAGSFMIVLGLGMTGRFPWAARLAPRPPKFLIAALSNLRRRASAEARTGRESAVTPVFFGLLTGLMPCAPLQSAQLTAAAAGSPIDGALAMLAFGLGTAPLVLGFGTASTMLPSALKQRVMAVLAVAVIVFGLVFVNRGLMLTGSPLTFDAARRAALGAPAASPVAANPVGADGVTEVSLTIRDVQFVPSGLSLPADTPVRLVVDRQEDNACSDQLAIPQLGVLVDLKAFGTTVVELPPAKAGAYTLTCGMGMMSGQINVGAPAQSGGTGLLLAVLGVSGVAGLAWTSSRKRRASSARSHPSAAVAARARGLLGFTPAETVLVIGAIAAAAVVGLALGGFFS